MLTLEIKDNQLNTSEDFTVQIDDQSPATKFDEIVGSKAIGIELTINDTNRTLLNNPDRFEKMGDINDRRFEQAALRHFGQIIHKGTLIIDEAKKSYSGWLRDIVGNLAERVSGKYINQSLLGGEKTFVNKSTYSPDTDDYACPKIFNRHFWRDRGKRSFRTFIAKDLEGNQYNTEKEDGELSWQLFENYNFLLNYPEAGGVAVGGNNMPAVVSPMLFLWRAVELILSDNYIFVKQNFLKEDESLKKLIVYHNYSIGKQELLVEVKTIFSTIYDENVIINLPSSVITNVAWSVSTFFYQNLLPKITLGKLILSLQNYLNVVFSFNDECRIVDRQKLMTQPAYDIDEYMVGEWELGERKDVTIKLAMKHDRQDYAFGDNWQDLSDIRSNIREPVQQKADLDLLTAEMDEIRKVMADDCYYQYHWYVATTVGDLNQEEEEDILGWERITIGFQPYFFNDGDKDVEEIETEFSTLRQSDNGYPLVMQKGNADAFKTQPEAFSPRLLFYEGDEVASYRTSQLSLDFDGENGMVKKRWNYWLPFWANRLPATATFKFPASVFYYVKNNKSILPFRTRHGSFIIDSIEARAGKADTIQTTLHVFKRESVVGFQSGSVAGSGEGTTEDFLPKYLGITATGKPYLINEVGETRIPPAWGTLSPAPFAKTNCIYFDPVNKLLFVGGYNGTLYITDLNDISNMTMKSIKVFSSGNVSAIRYIGSHILMGKEDSKEVYAQPFFAGITGYCDGQVSDIGILENGYTARDFLFVSGQYYACTRAGEVFRSSTLAGNWNQLFDVAADLRKMVETDTKLMTFGKDDNHNDDRDFYADKNNPSSWHEFDIESSQAVYVNEAIALTGDQVLVTTNKEYGGAKIINSDNTTASLTPGLARYCGGACTVEARPVVAIQEGSGATKLATWYAAGWSYLNVPMYYPKLFSYLG